MSKIPVWWHSYPIMCKVSILLKHLFTLFITRALRRGTNDQINSDNGMYSNNTVTYRWLKPHSYNRSTFFCKKIKILIELRDCTACNTTTI